MDHLMDLAGIILAAGESLRMGIPKALLRLEGRTFIEIISGRMREAGVQRIVAVIGADRDRVRKEASSAAVEWVVNRDFHRGQLSSLWCGLGVCGEEDGVVMTLVDHPLVKTETYRDLIADFMKNTESIVIPTVSGKRGHPILFAREHFPRFLEAPLEVGARWVVGEGRVPVREVPVEDPGIRADIDTPADYDRWTGEITTP